MVLASVGVLRLDGPQILLVRDAIAESYDYDRLAQDLLLLNKRLADVAGLDNLRNVAYHLVDTANREGWLLDLLRMFENARYPAVREIANRMLLDYGSSPGGGAVSPAPAGAAAPATAGGSGVDSAVADPYLSYLVGERPFVDRTVLRAHLKDLLSSTLSRVLVITGDRPCGKSYTWFYVRHLAQKLNHVTITPVLVDLTDWTDPCRPIDVMSSIALQLGLPEPTVDEHAQGAAQAQRLRDWLVGQLQPRDCDDHWLLVFDSLDHVAQREDTLQLIEFLAGAAIRQRLVGLRVVLLGYANRLPINPLESVLTEEIRDIGEPELRDFFKSLARQVNMAIADEAIDLAVQAVIDILPSDREQRLGQLPRTVRAIGNAVLGQRVLP